MQEWPTPVNVRELHGFLDLAGFYKKFVRNFAIIAKPLTNLLKHSLCTALVLGIPDFSQPFAIETDACPSRVSAVLLQKGHPLTYVRKSLGVKNQGLSTYEIEYLGILVAVDHWRSYLKLAKFIIYIDQKALSHLNDRHLHTIW